MLTTCRPEKIEEKEAWPTIPETVEYTFKQSKDENNIEDESIMEPFPLKVQNLEDFKTPKKVIEYPHFWRKYSMDKQWDHVQSGEAPEEGCLKLELSDLPLINFLDPNSIRSVGAFNRCVFQFGKD